MEWYIEYEVIEDRPGTLAMITSIVSGIGINILRFNRIAGNKRGLLVGCAQPAQIDALEGALSSAGAIRLTALKKPSFIDRIGLKHGKLIDQQPQAANTYCFVREDLGMLVDFLGELLSKDNPIIGLRGMPRVGKTEATIAACVYANKKWVVISSTLMRQIMRRTLSAEELDGDCVYLIDGIVSSLRGGHEHKELVASILDYPVPKVIEHPDIFLRENSFPEDFFDYIIELRRSQQEVIDYRLINDSFSAFDIS